MYDYYSRFSSLKLKYLHSIPSNCFQYGNKFPEIFFGTIYLLLWAGRSAANLPEYEAEAVDVGRLEAVQGASVQPLTEDLRGHVAPSSHPEVVVKIKEMHQIFHVIHKKNSKKAVFVTNYDSLLWSCKLYNLFWRKIQNRVDGR